MPKGSSHHESADRCGVYAACRRCRVSLLCQFQASSAPGVNIVKQHRRLRRGEFLYRQGDAFQALHTVCSGAIKTVISGGGSRNKRTAGFFIPGELVGAAGLTARRHSTDAVALEATEVSEILFSSVADAMDALPLLRRIMFQILADQLAHDEELLRSLVGKKAAVERLGAYLLLLAQRYEARGFSATELPLAMSRNDISNYLGLAKETVCRLLARFAKEGLVSVDAHRLHIHDRERLAQLANGVYGA
jgi:CRP/FNR family transcriptional regulator